MTLRFGRWVFAGEFSFELFQWRKDLGQSLFDRGEVPGRGQPDFRQIYAFVTVNQYVAESRHHPPRDFRMSGPIVVGKPLDRLSDHFEIPYYRILSHGVVLESVFPGDDVEANSCSGLDNMGEIDAWILGHSGRASF